MIYYYCSCLCEMHRRKNVHKQTHTRVCVYALDCSSNKRRQKGQRSIVIAGAYANAHKHTHTRTCVYALDYRQDQDLVLFYSSSDIFAVTYVTFECILKGYIVSCCAQDLLFYSNDVQHLKKQTIHAFAYKSFVHSSLEQQQSTFKEICEKKFDR